MTTHTLTFTLTLPTTMLFLFFLVQLMRSQPSAALNPDGVALLSFKYSILSDPLAALGAWSYEDQTPCGWPGVTCSGDGLPRVTGLSLPGAALLGSISPDLGSIDSLRRLDLSGNLLNGSLPSALFNASGLQFLSLAGNVISGHIPGELSRLTGLSHLNLSDNAFTGAVPGELGSLTNLTVACLKSNFLFGGVPSELSNLEFLDLSSNLLNASLPADFGGERIKYLNLSYNKIPGRIPGEFARLIPTNATLDLSFNSLAGAIPDSNSLLAQRKELFSGNPELCGKPLENLCTVPSSLSTPPNVSASSSPAIAAIPKTIDSSPTTTTASGGGKGNDGMRPGTIAGIAAADLAGMAVLAAVIVYVYRVRRRAGEKESDEASDGGGGGRGRRAVVTVDGESPEVELESLLKASAYVVGASSESIVYKAVMEDGSALAVRRIGKGTDEKASDFESAVRHVARLRHPNLLRLRGFYWGHHEKLLVYDFVSNGTLANTGTRRAGSSPLHQPLEVRMKIARGIARGLAYIHEKKHVHGNIKPSNVLLTSDMEPVISDLGLDRLIVPGHNNNNSTTLAHKPSGSARFFGSLKSSNPADHPEAVPVPAGPSSACASPYRAPESLNGLSKPSPKWDVFSFGVVLLELLSGRVLSDQELGPWSEAEKKGRVLRLVDPAIRAEAERSEDAVAAVLKLGFSCASFAPQKRPTMKEALQVMDKFPSYASQH